MPETVAQLQIGMEFLLRFLCERGGFAEDWCGSDGAVPADADPGSEDHDFAVEKPDTGVGETGWENERGIWESNLARAGTDEAYFQNAVLDFHDPQPDLSGLGTDAAYLVADLSNIVDHKPVEDSTTKHYRPERKKHTGPTMGGM